ncbi:MAG: hypothetical protein ACRDHF_14815 [Tepidiformaceae bacterium]
MPERDPFDYSALAPDADFGDDSTPVLGAADDLGAGLQFVLAEELEADAEFEADFESMAAEGSPFPVGPGSDEHYRQLQAALQRLGDGLVDLQLEADEAWLEALLLEDDADQPQASGAPAFTFDDLPGFDGEI